MNRGLIKSIYRTKSIENIDKKIKLLGDYNMNSITFLSLRIFTCIILFIILMFSKVNYFLIPLIIIAYYNLFYYVLITNKIKKRIKKLDNDALLFFSILTLTLESGKNLMNSLESFMLALSAIFLVASAEPVLWMAGMPAMKLDR